MRKITDKISLILCCTVLLVYSQEKIIPVFILLITISVSSLSQVFENKAAAFILQTGYIAVCLFRNEFWYCFPVVLYDIMYSRRRNILLGISGVSLILSFYLYETDKKSMLVFAVIAAVSVLLQTRTSELEKLKRRLIEIRDSSAENNILLNEKNRQLMDNQDYEIHLATLRERNRIAREIHDNVGHLLSRSILQVGALGYINDDNLRSESLASLSETLNNAMTTIRSSVHDLHDDSIDLKQSLEEIIKTLRENEYTVYADLDCPPDIPNNVKLCIIGVVREAVSNIIKHSSGDRVVISLVNHPAFRQLKIHDNGDCSSFRIDSGGIGLLNMRERVEKIGGVITFSHDRNGFGILVSLKKEV